jgi:hypothetical protein
MRAEAETPKKTTSATFRIDEYAYEIMQQDARMMKISVNTLVNQLLDLYVNSDRFMNEAGLVRITKPNFKQFLEVAPKDELAHIGESAGKNLGKTAILAKRGTMSLATVLEYIQGFAHYGGYAKYNETETNGKRVIVLVHDFGRAGSVYIGAYVKPLFEYVSSRPTIALSEDSVVIEL